MKELAAGNTRAAERVKEQLMGDLVRTELREVRT